MDGKDNLDSWLTWFKGFADMSNNLEGGGRVHCVYSGLDALSIATATSKGPSLGFAEETRTIMKRRRFRICNRKRPYQVYNAAIYAEAIPLPKTDAETVVETQVEILSRLDVPEEVLIIQRRS
ncbi:hypothetical protein PoB_004045800 [Plakobranchus ocellatus]|uniref:Uncharacterized protein n=1 Tax=Plakobranchus ocellatus TaxID=259542 RepID=A0AAV4B4E4_9GAST|nr:hypothetical protein PoB_004045800 [Plakobranchus ocellatus]